MKSSLGEPTMKSSLGKPSAYSEGEATIRGTCKVLVRKQMNKKIRGMGDQCGIESADKQQLLSRFVPRFCPICVGFWILHLNFWRVYMLSFVLAHKWSRTLLSAPLHCILTWLSMYMIYNLKTSYKGRLLYESLRPYDVMALLEVYTCAEHLVRPEILDHLCSTLGTS